MRPDMGRASPKGPARNALVTRQGIESRSVSRLARPSDELAARREELLRVAHQQVAAMDAQHGALLDAALRAARRGLPVFPVEVGGKRPAVDRWEERATLDPGVVRRAWSGTFAGCNIGTPPGRVGLLVVDLDCHGELPAEWRALPGITDGRDVFAQLLEWAGEIRLPQTRWTLTPSGGWHLWFRQPPGQPSIRNSAGLLGPGVDVRGAGGYVLVAGSLISGRAYALLDDREPAPCPAWLASRLALQPAVSIGRPAPRMRGEPSARLRGLVEHVRCGQPGDRNGRLYWAACRLGELVAAGQADQGGADMLVSAALDAGLRGGEPEARRTVASGLRAGRDR